jgi:hypothetical protein
MTGLNFENIAQNVAALNNFRFAFWRVLGRRCFILFNSYLTWKEQNSTFAGLLLQFCNVKYDDDLFQCYIS